jgi:hypothetical protein
MRPEGASQKGRRILVWAPMTRVPAGPTGRESSLGRGAGRHGSLGRLGQSERKIVKGFEFRISMDFGIWQDFEKSYKKIYKEFGHGDFS